MLPGFSGAEINLKQERLFKKTKNNVIDLKARLRRWRSEIWREDAAQPVIRSKEDQKVVDIADLRQAKALRDAASIIIGNFEGISQKEEKGLESKDLMKKVIKAVQKRDKKVDKSLRMLPDIEVEYEHNIIGRVDVDFWRRNRVLRKRINERS